jgi:hypothetical protein
MIPSEPPDTLLSEKDAAALLGCSVLPSSLEGKGGQSSIRYLVTWREGLKLGFCVCSLDKASVDISA